DRPSEVGANVLLIFDFGSRGQRLQRRLRTWNSRPPNKCVMGITRGDDVPFLGIHERECERACGFGRWQLDRRGSHVSDGGANLEGRARNSWFGREANF